MAATMHRAPAIVLLVAGCAHHSTGATTRPVLDTAVGAYLANPEPYRVASLASCKLDGPVSSDARATATGPITARCSRVVFRWNAVVADGVTIDGPPAIELAHSVRTSYAYSAMYTAAGKRIAGGARFAWALGADCDGIAELNNVGDSTFVVPTATGRCTLRVTEPQGHAATLAITIQ